MPSDIYTDDATREQLQKRYEEALTAVQLGINPFWMVLRKHSFEEEIEKIEQELIRGKSRRTKQTIAEIDEELMAISSLDSRLAWVENQLRGQRDIAIRDEAVRQGFETD